MQADLALLDSVDWRVQRGECWALRGHNGAGKSTLVRVLLGERQLTAGDVTVWGQPPPSRAAADDAGGGDEPEFCVLRSELHEGVGYVSTEQHLRFALAPSARRASVLAVVRSGLGAAAAAGADDVVKETAALLEIEGLLERPWGEVSQGEQQLALLGRALVGAPPLLVMDEVCQGLDARRRKRVLRILREICATTGAALVAITHHEDELGGLGCLTHELELRKGRVEYSGSWRESKAL